MLKPIQILPLLLSCLLCPAGQVVAQDSPPTLQFRVADDADTTGWQKMEVRGEDKHLFVSKEVSLDGSQIERVSFYRDAKGIWSIGFTLTDDGAKAMEAVTSENLNKKLAIVLDGEVVSAPTIRATISKQAQISGRFDKHDLLAFFQAIVLRELP